MSSAQSKTVTILKDSKEVNKESNNASSEVHYIFQRGVKLPARQIFYQVGILLDLKYYKTSIVIQFYNLLTSF